MITVDTVINLTYSKYCNSETALAYTEKKKKFQLHYT